ncbi:MAG: endonuclease/exonuclease/phosphatase family protein [Kiritimatiellia bacterium]
MKFSSNPVLDFLGGAVATGGALLCLASFLTLFARGHWILDLFSHFRPQMALGLIICSLCMGLCRKPWLLLPFLLICLVHLAVILSLYFPGASKFSPRYSERLRLLLINVNSSSGDPERVLDYVQQRGADVVILQEFSSRWMEMARSLKEIYPFRLLEIREDNFGMALFSRRPFLSEEVLYFTEEEVPSLAVELRLDAERFLLLATHPVPPVSAEYTRARNLQLQKIAAFVADSSIPVLLAGDLNTSPWSPVFRDLLRDSGLENSMQGFGIQPTWPTMIPPLWTPLDHVLHSRTFTTLRRKVGPDVGSDHFPVELTIGLRAPEGL